MHYKNSLVTLIIKVLTFQRSSRFVSTPVVHCQAANRLVTWTKNFTVTADFTRQRASLVSASPVVEYGSMLTTLCLCINQNLLDSRLPYDACVDINQRDIHCNDVSSSSIASAISQDGFITLLLKNAARSPGYKTVMQLRYQLFLPPQHIQVLTIAR